MAVVTPSTIEHPASLHRKAALLPWSRPRRSLASPSSRSGLVLGSSEARHDAPEQAPASLRQMGHPRSCCSVRKSAFPPALKLFTSADTRLRSLACV